MTKEENKITKVIESLSDGIENETINNFEKDFPTLKHDLETYAKDRDTEKVFYCNYYKRKIDMILASLYSFPKYDEKKYQCAIYGVKNGDLMSKLESLINYNKNIEYGTTDVVNKLYNGVIKHLKTGKVVNLYEEYTEEELPEIIEIQKKDNAYYQEMADKKVKDIFGKNFDWTEMIVPLEKIPEMYLGKPKHCSIKELKTSEEVIEWYYQLSTFIRKVCKMKPNEFIKLVGDKLND